MFLFQNNLNDGTNYFVLYVNVYNLDTSDSNDLMNNLNLLSLTYLAVVHHNQNVMQLPKNPLPYSQIWLIHNILCVFLFTIKLLFSIGG